MATLMTRVTNMQTGERKMVSVIPATPSLPVALSFVHGGSSFAQDVNFGAVEGQVSLGNTLTVALFEALGMEF